MPAYTNPKSLSKESTPSPDQKAGRASATFSALRSSKQLVYSICRKWSKPKAPGNPLQVDTASNPYADPIFPPPPPDELLSRSDHYREILSSRVYIVPPGSLEDTPTFALYRMYEYLILNETIGLRNELERFWFNRWPIASIPDPKDYAEPGRYAVLACIPALMEEAFNKRIELGIPRHADAIMLQEEIEEYRNAERKFERVPEWISHVRPLERVLKIPHDEGEILNSIDDERASPQLAEKNILCWQPHIHFI